MTKYLNNLLKNENNKESLKNLYFEELKDLLLIMIK